MLTVFRKLRRRLLQQSKLTKYLVYAVGEIILVVIGILIALQVNKWNEARIRYNLETDVLNEIRAGLKTDLIDIEYNIGAHQRILESQIKVLEWLNTDNPYTDTLSYHFARMNNSTVFVSNDSPYESLKQIGIRLIKDDSLRDKITRVYDLDFDYYKDHVVMYNEMVIRGWYDVNSNYFDGTRFMFNNPDNRMTPLDTVAIREENLFRHYATSVKEFNEFYIRRIMNRARRGAKELIEMLDSELADRD